MANNKSTETLRDGRLRATIWKNESEQGAFYSVSFTRSYTDADGNWHDSDSFSGSELLRIAHLAQKAHEQTRQLRSAESSTEPNGGET